LMFWVVQVQRFLNGFHRGGGWDIALSLLIAWQMEFSFIRNRLISFNR
jgi:hypothetical protein